ncbi:MAG: hypothetical protein R3321_02500 [Nitrososphaeraceae archaeon]|nr:hypothetical protein [Nitrososphaeraceae archaeon]
MSYPPIIKRLINMNKIKKWLYQAQVNGESFLDSFHDWWYFVKNGSYEGDEPYGQRVFFTYLGRTMEDAHKVLYDTYMDYE